ncbi:hypothetical protein [uncultured Devosia sp.]|uniref:hypothetical protein n=1 Tax=uncultured Devosia sp. TaxID=211434 RepID=UPI002602896C|nr:hypothetical protein [uncultured Devosia sp.]
MPNTSALSSSRARQKAGRVGALLARPRGGLEIFSDQLAQFFLQLQQVPVAAGHNSIA